MRVVGSFQWLLLVPYFWVKSWNVRPWVGEDRRFANRMNALCISALIVAFILGGVLYAIGFRQLPYSEAFMVVAYLVAVIAMGVWLNKDRERQYSTVYEMMPIKTRWWFGLAALALAAFSFWEIPVKNRPSSPKPLSCPAAAEETTAECS
jgi:hypothetical protein